MRKLCLLLSLLVLPISCFAQLKWYKFDKAFIDHHYAEDGSAIGTLNALAMHPAKNPHGISCGGDDGELHIGVEESALEKTRTPISAFGNQNDSGFGIVAEPPNVKRGDRLFHSVEAADGKPATFFGYFRLWNEGHDQGQIFPSNPHHVLEVHPVWAIRSFGFNFSPRPAVVLSTPGFSGYGASKFVDVLRTVPKWLRTAETDTSV